CAAGFCGTGASARLGRAGPAVGSERGRVESAGFGTQVVLANSGRKIAYSRLKVTDANGRELPARTEVATAPESKIKNQKSEILRVVVKDGAAVYPVGIDPTIRHDSKGTIERVAHHIAVAMDPRLGHGG